MSDSWRRMNGSTAPEHVVDGQTSGDRTGAERGAESTSSPSRDASNRPSSLVLKTMRRSCANHGARKAFPGQLGRAVWAAARSEYITGNESLSQLAKRLGVTKSAVEKHAGSRRRDNGGVGWDEARSQYLRETADAAESQSIRARSRTLAAVRESSANVASLALDEIARRLAEGPVAAIETRDLIGIAKLAGTLRMELAGDPTGPPVRIEHVLDQLTVEELRALAGRDVQSGRKLPTEGAESGSELPTEGGI